MSLRLGTPAIVAKDLPWPHRLLKARLNRSDDGERIVVTIEGVSEADLAHPRAVEVTEAARALGASGQSEIFIIRQGNGETVDHAIGATGEARGFFEGRFLWSGDATVVLHSSPEQGERFMISIPTVEPERPARPPAPWFTGGMKAHRKNKGRGKR